MWTQASPLYINKKWDNISKNIQNSTIIQELKILSSNRWLQWLFLGTPWGWTHPSSAHLCPCRRQLGPPRIWRRGGWDFEARRGQWSWPDHSRRPFSSWGDGGWMFQLQNAANFSANCTYIIIYLWQPQQKDLRKSRLQAKSWLTCPLLFLASNTHPSFPIHFSTFRPVACPRCSATRAQWPPHGAGTWTPSPGYLPRHGSRRRGSAPDVSLDLAMTWRFAKSRFGKW